MATRPKSIPEGFHTLTPHITVAGAARAIEFYERAFGAEELDRHMDPGGQKVMHATLRIGDSLLMLNDEFGEGCAKTPAALGALPITIHMYVADCDATFKRAVDAGAKEVMAPCDAFWGSRYGMLTDPFGHTWSIATHQEEVSPAELAQRAAKWFAQQGT
jgi:PhnB protein